MLKYTTGWLFLCLYTETHIACFLRITHEISLAFYKSLLNMLDLQMFVVSLQKIMQIESKNIKFTCVFCRDAVYNVKQ